MGNRPFLLLLASLAASFAPPTASALPYGRAWSPIDHFVVLGHTRVLPDRLEVDSDGNPILFAAIRGGIGGDTYGFHWADTTWAVSWELGYGVAFNKPVAALPGRWPMIWTGSTATIYNTVPLVMTEAFQDHVGVPDTITWQSAGIWAYSGAITSSHRWAATADYSLSGERFRVFKSEGNTHWRQMLQLENEGDNGVAVTSLDDTTALVAWTHMRPPFGIRWGRLEGDRWIPGDDQASYGQIDMAPQFRRKPSGGAWLAWSTDDSFVCISSFANGSWSVPDTLRCAYRAPDGYYSKDIVLSPDSAEYPVV